MRRLVAFAGAIGLAVVVASPAAAVKPSYGCGPGWDIGQISIADFIQLPRVQAAINDGAYSLADVTAALVNNIDRNGNGMVCAALSNGYIGSSDNSSHAFYFYNAEDDNSAKR